MREKLFGMNSQLMNNTENNQIQEHEAPEMQEISQNQEHQNQEVNGEHQEEHIFQNVDANDLNRLILLLQTQNILSNQTQNQENQGYPNLNELIAQNLQDQINESAQRIFQNPDLATPED